MSKLNEPSLENISFLTLGENDKVTLKQNYPFFYQVQGQMGVTGKNQCDFFVYTHFGIHQERITFNPEIWKNILQTLQQFWYKYLAHFKILLKALHYMTKPKLSPNSNIELTVYTSMANCIYQGTHYYSCTHRLFQISLGNHWYFMIYA